MSTDDVTQFSTRRLYISIAVFFLTIAAFIFGVFNFHTFFHLQDIEIVGSGAVFEVDAKKLSTNVLFFPTKKLEEDLKANYPLFETVRVTKKLPHAIVITYTLKDPWGYIESAGHTYGVDEHGVIVGEYKPPFVHPIMIFDIGVQSIGVKVTDARVRAALEFLQALDPSIQVSFVKEYSKTAFEVRVQDMRVILPVEGDMVEKATALLFLQNGFRIKGVLPSMVDLRFSKPIMTK